MIRTGDGRILLKIALALIALFYFLVYKPQWSNANFRLKDFTIFYTAGKILWAGEGARLYDLDTQHRYHPTPSETQTVFLPFNHFPFEALPFMLPSLLPYPTAYQVWNFCNAILLILVLWNIHSRQKAFSFLTYALILLAFQPTWKIFTRGQDSLIFLFFLSSCLSERLKGRTFLSGFLLGTAIFKPQLALPVAVGLAARTKRSFIIAFFLSVSLWFFISLMISGLDAPLKYLTFLKELHLDVRRHALHYGAMGNLHGMLRNLFFWTGPQLPFIVSAAYWFLNLAFVFWINFKVFRKESPLTPSQEKMLDAITITLSIIASFHLYSYDLVYLILPLVWLLEESLAQEDKLTRFFVWCAALFFLTPLSFLTFVHGRFLLVPIEVGFVAACLRLLK